MASSSPIIKVFIVLLFLLKIKAIVSSGNFTEDFDLTWGGNGRAKMVNNGDIVTLSLDEISGSGIESKYKYLFGNFHMQLKLVPGDSAGTVTTYYLWSSGSKWDEIDFGFFGNQSSESYVLHTNVVTLGQGNREQQFYLWFDPTAEFHTYSILWNPQRIIFAVDGTPIRLYKNLESAGVLYPKTQPMKIYCSIIATNTSASNETDWSEAPFIATYKNFDADESCLLSSINNTTTKSCGERSDDWLSDELDTATRERVRWVQNNYMIYSYCSDAERFPQGLPHECDIIY